MSVVESLKSFFRYMGLAFVNLEETIVATSKPPNPGALEFLMVVDLSEVWKPFIP